MRNEHQACYLIFVGYNLRKRLDLVIVLWKVAFYFFLCFLFISFANDSFRNLRHHEVKYDKNVNGSQEARTRSGSSFLQF